MIRLVLFDWDGPLYKSFRVNSEALDEMLAHFEVQPFGEANWKKLYSRPDYMSLYRELGITQGREEIWRVYEEKLRQKPLAPLCDHFEDTLRWLRARNITVIIVSMALPRIIEEVLEKYNLKRYVARIYAGIEHAQKVETIGNLIREFAPAKPEEAIFIDDSPHFIKEAEKFGCTAMAFLDGYHGREEFLGVRYDFAIGSLDSVQRYINYLNRKQSGELDPQSKRILLT